MATDGVPASMARRDWLIIALCCIALTLFAVVFGSNRDVDDTLRLLQVRDWLAGQSWFDLHQDRVAPPEGVPMHWSRLVDLPLAGVILAARPFVSAAQAEAAALLLVPLLTLACAAALIYRAAWRLFADRSVAALAALLGGTAAPLFGQVTPGRIDHHGWQIVLALVALNGLLAAGARKGGWLIGTALAAWLTISIEGLPATAAFLAVLGLRWLRDPAEREWLVHASAALAVVSAVLWLATHRLDSAALVGWCDVVTPIHLAMFAWTALGVLIVSRLPPRGTITTALGLGAVALVAGAILAVGQPQCLRGGFAQLDPLVARLWLASVVEAMPVWTIPLAPAMTMAAPPLLGLAAMGWWVWCTRPPIPFASLAYLLLLASASVMGCLMIRGFGVAAALAAPPLAWGLREWVRRIQTYRSQLLRLAAIAALMPALAPWLVNLAVLDAVRRDARGPATACDLARHSGLLGRLPPGLFLAPFDIGPDLLLATHHRVLASGHHRADAAMRDLLEAFLGSPDKAREILGRRQVDYVAICFDLPEAKQYAKLAPNGLLARLGRGETPQWLTPIVVPGAHAPKVWRVGPL
jgi:hypothetical protein